MRDTSQALEGEEKTLKTAGESDHQLQADERFDTVKCRITVASLRQGYL